MSEDHFIRRFRALMGVTPAEFGRRHRVALAAEWLTGSRRTIEDIAEAAGFSDRSHFSRVFRQHLGVTPAEHRGMHKLEVVYRPEKRYLFRNQFHLIYELADRISLGREQTFAKLTVRKSGAGKNGVRHTPLSLASRLLLGWEEVFALFRQPDDPEHGDSGVSDAAGRHSRDAGARHDRATAVGCVSRSVVGRMSDNFRSRWGSSEAVHRAGSDQHGYILWAHLDGGSPSG